MKDGELRFPLEPGKRVTSLFEQSKCRYSRGEKGQGMYLQMLRQKDLVGGGECGKMICRCIDEGPGSKYWRTRDGGARSNELRGGFSRRGALRPSVIFGGELERSRPRLKQQLKERSRVKNKKTVYAWAGGRDSRVPREDTRAGEGARHGIEDSAEKREVKSRWGR